MNIARSFVTHMESLALGTFGTNIFIGGVPENAPSTCWWVITAGGASAPKNNTGERIKAYTVNVFYRNMDAEVVYEQMQALEEEINSKNCTQLTGYDTVDMTAIAFPADQDLDIEDRTVALLQVGLTTYQS